MNIAVNCRLLQREKLEGIGWFMYESLKRITVDHPEHQFFFIFDRKYDEEFIFSDNIHPIIAGPPTRHPLLWYYWMEFTIPSVLKKVEADLFFSPDGYLSLRSGVPSVPVIHDINFAHRPKDLPFWTRKYYNYFFPKFAGRAKRICTVSEFSKNDLNKTYGVDLSLIDVVYNGANPKYLPIEENKKQIARDKYTEGKPYFLFIGSLHPRKNLNNLIKAYDKFVEKTGSDIKLVIVGAAMWRNTKSFRDLIGPHNESRVIFTGRLDQEELGSVLASAFALTFVPWFEGFGIPVLEAMYVQLPVLTSTETSLPEVGGEAALYAYPNDIEEIASKMEIIVSNNEIRNNLITRGKEQKLKFSWDKTAEKVWKSLESVLIEQKR